MDTLFIKTSCLNELLHNLTKALHYQILAFTIHEKIKEAHVKQ